ncbi:unnamed protein product [Fraxinus pennsylvanica]|uniref:Uncharacterized protein n=1 Tax=Fraxinus pennsylvanica TaxID=56036 RepID=A0AAD2E6I8_9LAMI|nr:unnamed protein product [Fraxinus pennsylvanica]
MGSFEPAMTVLDSKLQGTPDQMVQEMLQTLGIAMFCVNSSLAERPTIKEVALMESLESHAPKASGVHGLNGQDLQKESRKTGYGGGYKGKIKVIDQDFRWRKWRACYGYGNDDPVIQLNHEVIPGYHFGDVDSSTFSGEASVWKKNILMGGKCELPDFSGVIIYDSAGNVVTPAKTPRALPWK